MADPSARFVPIMDALKLVLEQAGSLGLEEVYYDQQPMIIKTPSAALEFDSMERELTSTGLRTTNNLVINIYLYLASITSGQQVLRRDLDNLLEDMIEVLDRDARQLGGLIGNGYVTRAQAAITRTRSNEVFQGAVLRWEALIKVDRVM